MHSEITMITPRRVQNSIFIGEVFQIEVSDGKRVFIVLKRPLQ